MTPLYVLNNEHESLKSNGKEQKKQWKGTGRGIPGKEIRKGSRKKE